MNRLRGPSGSTASPDPGHAGVGSQMSHTEIPQALSESAPKTLSFADQFALWSSLGITLTIPAAAIFVQQPLGSAEFSFTASLVALALGLLLGSLVLGGIAHIGAKTSMPTMVMMRGIFGRRGSYFPTILNIAQCVGWSAVEILVIGHAGKRVTGGSLSLWLIGAGVVSTLLALKPLRFIKALRKYILWAVIITTIYLFIEVISRGVHIKSSNSWNGFWIAVDIVVALPISWAPLVADYSRHAKKGAFLPTFTGYLVGAGTFFLLGLLALVALASSNLADVYGFSQAILLLPFGALALLILIVDEVDEAFANIYSTVASLQNFNEKLNRTKLAYLIGSIATLLALAIDVVGYESFLFAIGAIFVPLCGVVLIDWFVISKGLWNLSATAKWRPSLALSWLIGFITYQLINPGYVAGWSAFWKSAQSFLGFTPQTWMSASLLSFLVSAVMALLLNPRSTILKS